MELGPSVCTRPVYETRLPHIPSFWSCPSRCSRPQPACGSWIGGSMNHRSPPIPTGVAGRKMSMAGNNQAQYHPTHAPYPRRIPGSGYEKVVSSSRRGAWLHTALEHGGRQGTPCTNLSRFLVTASIFVCRLCGRICAVLLSCTSAGVRRWLPLWQCSSLYHSKNPWPHERAATRHPSRGGSSGRTLRVLPWDSEQGLSLDPHGCGCDVVTPRSTRTSAMDVAFLADPGSASCVNSPGGRL